MPLTRYQIRNEYSLADPELYRAADRDDPEALLEGVAMAGLVGVLRQLGDLAEFAAEIFHDLHEEVMATAARGHGLTIRVQQLEAEFPSIEKEFLSQTSHSQFLLKSGIDWHPNLRMDQSMITQGDLPRFVMESYEECRGPPRLFLLDKFDIAGAGACLKRYSDPSFFKAEFSSSQTTKAEVQKDKKARKFKKKGSRWRNGETPEVFAASSAKLHQLFSEERSQTGNAVPSLRVRLKKRQLNGSFDSTMTRKSYMEKFLETRSPDREVVCESFVSPPRLKTASSNTIELDLEIPEISTETPVNKFLQRERSPDPSPSRQESVLRPSTDELRDDVIERGTFEKLPKPNPENEVEKISFSFYKVEDKKESVVDGERKTEASTDGYRSDDIASEMDNYMDALATMESEMETDTECGPKNEQGFFNIERQGVDCKELQARFSDSHSIGNSSASDDGNNSFKKGRSSFSYSDTLSNSAENVPSDGDVADQADPCMEIPPVEIVDMSFYKFSRNGDNLGTKSPKRIIHEGTCQEVSEIPSYRSEFGEAYSNSCITESISTPHLSPEASLSGVKLVGAGLIEVSSDCLKAGIVKLSNCEDDLNIGGDLPCATNVSDFSSQLRDDYLPTGTAGSQPVKELDGGTPDASSEAQVCPSMEISPVEIVDISFYKLSRNGDDLGTKSPKHVIPNGTFHEVSEIPSYRPEFGEAYPNSCIADSTSTPSHLSPGESLSGVQLAGPGSIEVSSGCMKAGIMKSSNGEDDLTLGSDLPCTTNVSDFSSQMKDDYLPTATAERQPVEELDGGTPDVSSVSDVVLQKKNDDDALGEVFPLEYAEDSSSIGKVVNGKLDTPHSVTFTTGQIHGLAGQDIETYPGITSPPESLPASTTPCDLDDVQPEGVVAEIDDVIPLTGEKFEYLKTVTDVPETGDFAEHDFPEMTDEFQPPELDSAEVDIPCSEVKMLFNNLEVSSNTSDFEKKDKSTPDMVQLNSLASVGRDAVSLELPSDYSEPTSVTVVRSQIDDLTTGTIQAEAAAADDDTSMRSNLICSPSRNHLKLQEECFSSFGDLHQKKLEIKKASSPEYLMGLDAQKEVNRVAVAPTDLNFKHCSAESCDPFSSKLLNDVDDSPLGEKAQNDLHPSDGTVAPATSKECDQESESKSPYQSHLSESAEDAMSSSTHSLSGPGIPLEQALELQADRLNVESLHEDGESSKSSILQSEQTQFSNHIDQIGCIDAPSKSCPADSLSQPSESEFSPLPGSHKSENFEPAMDPLDSISPSVGLLSQATHQHLLEPLPSRPVFDFLSPHPNAIQVNLEEMPPLPPLPPMQWRIGKLQHGFLASEGEMLQPRMNPFSPLLPATEDEKAQMDFPTLEGESAQPLNPFLSLSDVEDEKLQYYSEMLGGEMVQHSLNPFLSQVPTVVDDEISQEGFLAPVGKITEPLNPFLTLPAIDDERPEHGSRTLGGETVQPTLNPLAPLPTSEFANIRYHSLSLQGRPAEPLNPLAPNPGKEDENLQHTSTNSEKEMENPPLSFAPLLTREDEQPQHGLLTLEGESSWPSNSYALLLAVEDGNANGNRHMRHPRPRDPLIEAVASHDKSTLRKVREQDQPLTRLKVDERDSLLEQIRTKSFNLKPALLTRPNIQGPKTNLKVAAILEKANAIRQALAGSDEDDDGDNWSDS